jgi:excisionase family DNA binding protein
MARNQIYSTREVAQMWNISESTVKRWADAHKLKCYRTPGGHRKFRLEDIREFQNRRGFEATGLLSTTDWEDPNLEVWLNQKNFRKVRGLISYLAVQNQRHEVRSLLERLYLRGMGLEEIYDDILVPLYRSTVRMLSGEPATTGQTLLLGNNIEEALYTLFPRIIQRRKNGRTALCAATAGKGRLVVNGMARILEIEGWEALNLGQSVPFRTMAEMVETEPVNLVCLAVQAESENWTDDPDLFSLVETAENYRIPIVAAGKEGMRSTLTDYSECLGNFRSFRYFLQHLN